MIKRVNLCAAFMMLMCAALNAAAQRENNLPENPPFAPDLQVKEVKAVWLTNADKGAVLEVTPVIQKNKNDKITMKTGEPMIIFVGTLNQDILNGPTCKIKVTDWTSAETEKSFGSCLLKPKPDEIIISGVVIVDDGNRVKELNEKNNIGNIKIPPKPEN